MEALAHDSAEWAVIDRRIVMIATGAAGLFLVILMSGWLYTGDSQLLMQAAAPFSVGGTGVAMLLAGRPRPLVQVAVGAVGLILFVAVNESEVPGNPLIGLLIMGIVAFVLTHRHVVIVGLLAVVTLSATGYAWHPTEATHTDRMVMAFSLVVAFVLTAWILYYLKSRSSKARGRLHDLVSQKNEFLATVSHELRTPLATVVAGARALNERWQELEPEEIAELTQLLVDQSSDLTAITDDLLVASRSDLDEVHFDRRVVDVNEVVTSYMREAGTAQAHLTPAPAHVMADQLRLRQVLRNLVTNAVRYGGDVVRVRTEADGAVVTIEVRDNGDPVPADEREAIFDPYHRAGATGEPGSVGLGLTVARRLIRLMGGDVSYDHDGLEAVFSVTLPQVGAPERLATEHA